MKKPILAITDILYALVVFVLADGIGANLERALLINRAGHAVLLIFVFLASAVFIGFRCRWDEKPGRRIISGAIFGFVSAIYALGLTTLDHEPWAMGILLLVIGVVGAGVAVVVSQVAARLKNKSPVG